MSAAVAAVSPALQGFSVLFIPDHAAYHQSHHSHKNCTYYDRAHPDYFLSFPLSQFILLLPCLPFYIISLLFCPWTVNLPFLSSAFCFCPQPSVLRQISARLSARFFQVHLQRGAFLIRTYQQENEARHQGEGDHCKDSEGTLEQRTDLIHAKGNHIS